MNKDLEDFIQHHKIDLADIIDADGLSISVIRNKMKENDILFAYNTTPCNNGGHTIRDRQSHCIVCNTVNIAFMKRTKATGFIYIAGSIFKNYIKIGMTTEDVNKRIIKLNSRGVGKTYDWVVIKAIKCDYANKVELGIHKELEKYKVKSDLYDYKQESSEIFRCKYEKANEILEKYLEENKVVKKEQKNYLINPEKYNNFKNLVNPEYNKQ